MGKIFTSLKLAGLYIMLTSAVASYGVKTSSASFDYPKQQINSTYTWQHSPLGIFALTIEDTSLNPDVSAPADISTNTDIGTCTAVIDVPDASHSTGSTLSWSFSGDTSGSGTGQVGTKTFTLGTTIINYTATDAEGNTSHDSATVTIADNEDPNITLGNAIFETTDAGQCNASIAIPNATFSDNCTGSNINWSLSGATTGTGNGQVGTHTFNIGTTTINYTVTDAAGNSTHGALTVDVEDNEDPEITLVNAISEITDAGKCTATVAVPDATFSDNCSETSISWSMSGATTGTGNGQVGTHTFNIGTTTINYTVTDAAGNSTPGALTVDVEDNENPEVTLGNAISETTDAGKCTAAVAVPDATFSDNCSGSSISWSMSGATTASGTGQIGTHTFNIGTTTINYTVTDAAGNTTPRSLDVNVQDDEEPVIDTPADITVNNDTDACGAIVTYSVSASDNCSSLTPTLTQGIASGSEFPVGTTTVTYTATDEAGNTSTESFNVTVKDNQVPVAPTLTDILWGCEYTVQPPVATDNCDSNVTVSANRSTTFTESGTIIWSFTDDAGNVSTAQQTITISPVQATSEKVDILCFGDATGEITVNASGGVPPYTYTWSGNLGTGATKTGLTAGTYTVTVKDINDCEAAPLEITLTEPSQLTLTSLETTPVTCNGAGDGSVIAGEVAGGVGAYQYQVTGRSFQSSKEFNNLPPGSYTYTIKDQNSCLLEQDFEISEPAELSMTTPTTTEVTCYGGSDGTITSGNVTGGTPPYEYSIDNVNFYSTTAFEGVSAGNHTIFVKDAEGCALQVPVTVSQPDVLAGNLSKINVSCHEGNDGSITVSNPTGGHGSFEFSIDGTNWQSGTTFSGLPAGTYSVSVRDAAYTECVVVLNSSYVLTEPGAPVTAEATTTRTTSYGTSTGSATVNATGGTPGYTYEWRRKGEGNVIQSTKTATNLSAGFYEVTVIDSQGCKSIKEVEIIDALQAFILTRSTCEVEDDSDAIRTFHYIVEDETAHGGVAPYTYSWNFGDGAVNPDRSGIGEFYVDYNTTGNKIITLTVTDSTGSTYTTTQEQYVGKCYNPCGRSSNIEFDPQNIYLGYANGDRIETTNPDYCDNSVPKYIFIQVDKSANIYNPYIELGFIISNDISDVTTQYYASGCRSGDAIDEDLAVNQPNRVGGFIQLTLDPIEFNCGDNLNIDTFYTTWTNVSKKECGQNNNKFCYSTNEPVYVPTELRAEATPTHILCKGGTTGTITVKASGGFAPYAFKLSENATSQSHNQFVNLSAGDYTIYIEDAAGKKTTTTATVLEPDTALSVSTEVTPPSCFGETVSATVIPSGGTPSTTGEAYQYLWNDPAEQTTATATNLSAGEYTVTVIDANGCQVIETISITQPAQLTVAETGPDQTFGCGFHNTLLEANEPVTGVGTWTVIDAPNSDWELTEPNNPTSAFSAPAGTYTLRWTIAHADGTCGTSSDILINFKGDCSTLDYDGIDDYVFIGDRNNFPSSDFTLEVWVKPESVQGVRTVLSKRNTENLTSGGYDLVINNGAPTFRWNGKSVSTSHKVGTDRWYHLAVIFKGSEVELYVDGIRVGNSTGTKPVSNSFPLLIGAMHDANDPEVPKNYFEGWIEELRVWNSALTVEQIRFMMNQRIEANGTAVKGEILPMDVPGDLKWSSLVSYYRLIAEDAQVANGIAVDRATNGVDGHLRNIESLQQNTAPLPYISEAGGQWKTRGSWDINIGGDGENHWTWPNDKGINGTYIDWNIAYVTHELNSGNENIHLLGFLLNGGELDMLGNNQTRTSAGSGNGLTITKYLDLSGFIDLNGESQLIQTEGSILVGNGSLHRDQQGTASSYNYNYWSSPVSPGINIDTYTIASVMKDGVNSKDDGTPKNLDFGNTYHYADGGFTNPRKVSKYWLHKFHGRANNYFAWEHIGSTGTLQVGEGFSMKGTSGYADVEDLQNYTFVGMPNNGRITLNIGVGEEGENYLVGNPYPSAIDAYEFIRDNLANRRDGKNIFNGSIYFWDHFAGATHYLQEYIGGYATYNLSGGTEAISNDERVNDNNAEGSKKPGRYIPVAQAFFVNSKLDQSISESQGITIHGGDILFKNSQRAYKREGIDEDANGEDVSVFHSQEKKGRKQLSTNSGEYRKRIWIKYISPAGYHRQILVTADENASSGFDLGYDGPMIENNKEDMYWLINGYEFTIQGVPDFGKERVLPLGIKTAKGGEFTIAIDELQNIPSDFPIYVWDSIENSYHNLRNTDFKAQDATGGNIRDRYSIVFHKAEDPVDPVDPVDPEEGESEGDGNGETGESGNDSQEPPSGEITLVYSSAEKVVYVKNPDLIPVKNAILYNSLGQEIKRFGALSVEPQVTLPIETYSRGVYFLQVILEEGNKSLKFLVEQM